jgi:hypothetical protein
MQNRIHDLDEENVKAKEKDCNCIVEIVNNDINESNSKDEESTNYDQNELYFVKNISYKYKKFLNGKRGRAKRKRKKSSVKKNEEKKESSPKNETQAILKEEDNKTEKVEPIIFIEEKDTLSEIISKQGNIHNNFGKIFFDYLFKKLTKQENKSPEDFIHVLFSKDLEKKNIKDEFKEVLGISLENEEYKELLEKTPCEYLDKKIGELPAIINEGKKRNKITECNKKIIKELHSIFDIYKIEEEKGKNNSSKNIENKENLYDINVIKDKAKKIFSLEPSDEDKKEIYKKTGKKNRLDNLYKIAKKIRKKKNENKDKNETEDKNEKEEKNENKKMDKETNYTYFNSDFSEYVKQCEKEVLKDESKNESEKAKNLIKKKSKVEEKEKRFSLFEKDLDDVIKKYQNSKCRKKTFEFCKSKDIKGLLSILNFVRPAKEKEKLNKVKKTKKDKYESLKIKDSFKFEKIVNEVYGENSFSLKLNEEESEEILDRIKKLNILALTLK